MPEKTSSLSLLGFEPTALRNMVSLRNVGREPTSNATLYSTPIHNRDFPMSSKFACANTGNSIEFMVRGQRTSIIASVILEG